MSCSVDFLSSLNSYIHIPEAACIYLPTLLHRYMKKFFCHVTYLIANSERTQTRLGGTKEVKGGKGNDMLHARGRRLLCLLFTLGPICMTSLILT